MLNILIYTATIIISSKILYDFYKSDKSDREYIEKLKHSH